MMSCQPRMSQEAWTVIGRWRCRTLAAVLYHGQSLNHLPRRSEVKDDRPLYQAALMLPFTLLTAMTFDLRL
ncbi:hypothetical protein C0J50_1421 [Silurus asotus]|uniref:Uncharacterized protein n=1 Tax=Silurus asotus TaxID=30991 RepID=A0AAD5A9F4_SILAS|nr:hypothetical protein C0J50_1421 [Silurus asotus]